MIRDERLGTAEEVRTSLSASALPVFDRLRAIMVRIDDQSTETASPKEKALYYTLGRGKMTDGYAYIMGHAGHVNLGFFHGVDLPDPENRLEGTGKKLRHVKLRTIDDAGRPCIRDLIEAAHQHMMLAKGQP
jgi:Domain of unknown function (DU1801)